jgi:hypothetical protein
MITTRLAAVVGVFSRMLFVAALVVATVGGTTATAGMLTGVGQDPPPPMGPFTGDDENGDMIMVGDVNNPIPIVPVPGGPPWMKEFIINRDGQVWGTSGDQSMVTVMEVVTFLAGPSSIPGTTGPRVIDWHEDIDPTVGDGALFKWAGGTIELFGSGAPPIPGEVGGEGGRSIWFNFPPFPPGLPVKITKQLMFAGDGPITHGPDGTNNYRIKVNERPSVPEPGALVLVALAALGVLRVGRRR